MSENRTLDVFDPETGKTLVSLARETIAQAARTEADIPTATNDTDAVPDVEAGAFVTIKRGDRLRGCIGRIEATQSATEAVTAAAVDAARNDPRTSPVELAELSDITVTVTVLSEPTEVNGELPEATQTGRDGLIVRQGPRQGLLLPQVATERNWEADTFLAETCRKAGLPGDSWQRDGVTVETFTARTFAEREPRGPIEVTRYDAADESTGQAPTETLPRERPEGDPVTDGGRAGGEGIRPPTVAGEFYAGEEDALREQIESSIHHDHGPGTVEVVSESEPARTVVSPHAGLPYSGPVAAHGYAALSAGSTPDTVVILGPNHDGVGPSAALSSHEAWRTPLGTVPVDETVTDALVAESDLVTVDDDAHRREHSIEVQIPFLQYLLDSVSVVPVCLNRIGQENAERLGHDIASVVEGSDREVTVVSSTDLTHHLPHERAVSADEPIREAIRELDTDAIADAVADGHSMCGPWATVAGLTAAAERGATDATLLAYATSGETAGPESRVVGYCSAIV